MIVYWEAVAEVVVVVECSRFAVEFLRCFRPRKLVLYLSLSLNTTVVESIELRNVLTEQRSLFCNSNKLHDDRT